MKQQMTVNFQGRVNNFKLNKSDALLPLFESVVNSIQAIEDRQKTGEVFDGSIDVTVKRLPIIKYEAEDLPLGPIQDFIIEDNGIGFNDDNYASFLECDSQYKVERGGKGVGRLCWLKAFSDVHVSSVFYQENLWQKRTFDFNLRQTEIDDHLEEIDSGEYRTCVRLIGIDESYSRYVPADIDAIASAIMYHCVAYLMDGNCPIILVHDGERSINVNELFADALQDNGKSVEFTVSHGAQTVAFKMLHLMLDYDLVPHGSRSKPDRIILCANNRSVESIALDDKISGLCPLLHERHRICYVGLVAGEYLDENVDMNRLSFVFPDNNDDLFYEVTRKDIVDGAVRAVGSFLSVYAEEANQARDNRVMQYLQDVAPQYRPLSEYAQQELSAISYKASDDDIDNALYKARRRLDREVKERTGRLLDGLDDDVETSEDAMDAYAAQLKSVAIYNYTALAEYVIHRKTVLDFFERGLRKKDDGKFEKEKYLHNLLFTMGTSSEEISYDTHNLWMIDERLTYCGFIASDQQMRCEGNKDRPDILVLDAPVMMSPKPNDGTVFDTVIIFELKKPMRNDYTERDNPINQLFKYARQIRSGRAEDANGRPIKVNSSTRLYLYAVCDITSTLEAILENYSFDYTPDGIGRYMYNKQFNAHVEVISFDKLVNDAKMRNHIFFEKLGIEA